MKKIFLLLVSLFFVGFSFANYRQDLHKYYSEQAINKVDTILNNWNQKVLKSENPLKTYDKVLAKIKLVLNKKLSNKIKLVILYLQEVISSYKQDYLSSLKKENTILTGNNLTGKIEEIKINGDIDFSILKRDSIIVPISGKNYAVLGFYLRSLYGGNLLHSLLIENQFGNEADIDVRNLYLLDINKKVLAKTKLTNGKAYFQLKSPYLLPKDVNTSFYVVVELNNINSLNKTNKKLKFKLLKQYNTFETLVTSVDNGSKTNYWITNSFNSNTYIIRKAKPIISNVYTRKRLKLGTNKIFSFNIASTGSNIQLSKLVFDTYISPKAEVDTGDIQVYIDNQKYTKLKSYFLAKNGNTKLVLDFNYPYSVGTKAKKIDIVANFIKNHDKAYILTRLKNISDNIGIVSGDYTGTYSILWGDNSYKGGLTKTTNAYFTDAKLNFDNIKEWYLKKD